MLSEIEMGRPLWRLGDWMVNAFVCRSLVMDG